MNWNHIWGIVISVIVVFVFKVLLGLCLAKNKEECKAITILKKIYNAIRLVGFVFSIDYLSADILKNGLDKKEMQSQAPEASQNISDKGTKKYELRKKSIVYSNKINFALSFVFVVAAFCIAKFCTNKAVCEIAFGFVGYRLLSRTIEINFAFVKDITSNNPKTDLKGNDRASLAIKSLCEEILLFAGVYIFFLSGDFLTALTGGLYSVCLDIFNAEVNDLQNLFKFVAVYQKVCSSTLVSLCIVNYFARLEKGKQSE